MEIHDENQSGRPSVPDGVVEKVETMLLEDRRITIHELALLIPEAITKCVRSGYRESSQKTINSVSCVLNSFCNNVKTTRKNSWIPLLQEHLGGQRFSTDDEVKEEVTRFLKGLTAEFYNMGIEKLEHRLQKCLDKNGDYVGK
ncbi:hypothetical protein J6590_045093 [Homalodisca vitripennis]|nr:hypothetical protein J6590_045093 [Homalodisca vitripennis]